MPIANRTTAATLRAASFVILSTVAAAGAMATTDSTDIYGASGFAASFGHSGSVAQAGDLGRAGSTDIHAYNGIGVSFGAPAQAEDRAKPEAARLGEHPAVVVARRGVQVDPASKFYPHPAWLYWSLQRPLSDGEEPLLVAAHGERNSAIDQSRDAVARPALGAPLAARP